MNAARIGPLGIATNAGELFVEWGLSVKERSPFPHTIVSELTLGAGDLLSLLPGPGPGFGRNEKIIE